MALQPSHLLEILGTWAPSSTAATSPLTAKPCAAAAAAPPEKARCTWSEKTTLAAVEAFFADATAKDLHTFSGLEKQHGRCERREYSISGDLTWFHKSWKWSGLASVARVVRTVQRGAAAESVTETHYYLRSIPADAQRLAELVRGHWSIENRCHWVLDVVFGEDHCQARDPNAARNLSIPREAALKALRTETSKGTLSSKRKRAALEPQFGLALLLALQA